MKKIYSSMMAIAIAAFTFTACEDVPEPYNNPYDQLKNNTGGGENGSLPYTSDALNTGWSLQSVTADQPWVTGANYAQATGYQKWDGASTKSNKAVEGWLVSPAISTVGFENVKLSFDNTIKYTNNVTGWADNHKVYASTSFDGTNASTDTWTELSFTPVASTYSDWTLYSSGEIQLPAEFVGKETVYIGFWFKAPEGGSTTWELKNFKMEEGIASGSNNPDNQDEETIGTKDEPITVAKALDLINNYADGAESPTDAYVKGTIVSVGYYDSNHKSLSYYVSDDGTATNQLQIYSGKGLNGADFSSKDELKAGAIVVVKGKLKKYVDGDKVTPEINMGSTIISIENNGNGDTPSPSNDSSIDNPYTIAKALEVANALDDNATTSESFYIKGKVTRKANTADEIGPNSTKKYKDMNYYISEDGTESNELYVYRGKYLDGADFTDYEQLKVSDEVIVYGQLQKYIDTKNGNAVVLEVKNSKIVKLNGEGGQGNDDPQPGDTKIGTLEGNVLTLTFSEASLTNQEKPSTLTLADGTTLTFGDGGNKNAPAYYTTGTALRMYPNNTMAINAGSKKIAAIEIACDSYQGTLYNASGDITIDGTKMTIDGDNLKFNGPNASTANVANTSSTTGAASQLRMKVLMITYAE